MPGVHTLAGDAYREVGEFEKASIHIKALAEHHASNGNLKKATTLFQEVLEMLPTDLAACQRVVELSIDHSELATDDFDPLNVGKDLVDLYLEIGEIDRVRALLEEVQRYAAETGDAGNELQAHHAAWTTLVVLGEPARAYSASESFSRIPTSARTAYSAMQP